jgi:hypothetical protein
MKYLKESGQFFYYNNLCFMVMLGKSFYKNGFSQRRSVATKFLIFVASLRRRERLIRRLLLMEKFQ